MLYYFLMLGEKYFLFSATFPTSPTWLLKTSLKINVLHFSYVGNVANVGSKQSFFMLYYFLMLGEKYFLFSATFPTSPTCFLKSDLKINVLYFRYVDM